MRKKEKYCNRHFTFFSFVFVLLVMTACTSEYGEIKNIKSGEITETVELRATDSVVYHLGSSVSHIMTAFDYNLEKQIFSFYVSDTVYRYKKDVLYDKIPVRKRHINSFSSKEGFLWAVDYNGNRLFKVDSLGGIVKDLKIKETIKYFPLPITKTSPIIEDKNKVYFFGNISGEYSDENEENRRVMGVYDLETQKLSCFVAYPKEYEHNFGGGLFRWVYADYNSKERRIIISFPASHSLYVYDIDNLEKEVSFYAGSRFIESIKYLKSPKMFPIDAETKVRHFAETPSYSRVIFDPFREVYYRIAEQGTVYEGMVGWSKEISVIVLDKTFKIIGETFVGKCLSNYRYAIYVDQEGLKIPVQSSEDVLIFKNYELCNIEK